VRAPAAGAGEPDEIVAREVLGVVERPATARRPESRPIAIRTSTPARPLRRRAGAARRRRQAAVSRWGSFQPGRGKWQV
jgi:hypothetical protein